MCLGNTAAGGLGERCLLFLMLTCHDIVYTSQRKTPEILAKTVCLRYISVTLMKMIYSVFLFLYLPSVYKHQGEKKQFSFSQAECFIMNVCCQGS